jgi:DNA-binding NtrC family response regulator
MIAVRTKSLFISNSREHPWLPVLEEALTSFGTLDLECENNALKEILKKRYDIIIIDATSIEDISRLLSPIRGARPLTHLVVATASPTWESARAAFQAGATDCIHKTKDVEDLRSTFEHILARATCAQEDIGLVEEQMTDKATILFADNHTHFLNTRKEFLERAGYRVITADNLEAARRILEGGQIDLAILDIRLVDDDDEKDTSGLTLARETNRFVPKIILTRFPTPDVGNHLNP